MFYTSCRVDINKYMSIYRCSHKKSGFVPVKSLISYNLLIYWLCLYTLITTWYMYLLHSRSVISLKSALFYNIFFCYYQSISRVLFFFKKIAHNKQIYVYITIPEFNNNNALALATTSIYIFNINNKTTTQNRPGKNCYK